VFTKYLNIKVYGDKYKIESTTRNSIAEDGIKYARKQAKREGIIKFFEKKDI